MSTKRGGSNLLQPVAIDEDRWSMAPWPTCLVIEYPLRSKVRDILPPRRGVPSGHQEPGQSRGVVVHPGSDVDGDQWGTNGLAKGPNRISIQKLAVSGMEASSWLDLFQLSSRVIHDVGAIDFFTGTWQALHPFALQLHFQAGKHSCKRASTKESHKTQHQCY